MRKALRLFGHFVASSSCLPPEEACVEAASLSRPSSSPSSHVSPPTLLRTSSLFGEARGKKVLFLLALPSSIHPEFLLLQSCCSRWEGRRGPRSSFVAESEVTARGQPSPDCDPTAARADSAIPGVSRRVRLNLGGGFEAPGGACQIPPRAPGLHLFNIWHCL